MLSGPTGASEAGEGWVGGVFVEDRWVFEGRAPGGAVLVRFRTDAGDVIARCRDDGGWRAELSPEVAAETVTAEALAVDGGVLACAECIVNPPEPYRGRLRHVRRWWSRHRGPRARGMVTYGPD